MYTIYHIPGVKVGATGRNPKVRVKEQGYNEFQILEVLDSLELASEREIYWQEKLGYGRDNNSYFKQVANPERIKKCSESATGKKRGSYDVSNDGRLAKQKAGLERRKPILVKYPDGKIVEYDSVFSASKKLLINNSSIGKKIKNGGGYIKGLYFELKNK
jgi:hypothetical protein